MEVARESIKIAILFAILFIIIGWMAPVAYASYAPQSTFIEVHEFRANDASVGSSEHMMCLDRTVHQPTTATVFVEMYLQESESGERIEVDSSTLERYFQEGRQTVQTPYPLPDNLAPGDYRYEMVVQMNLANGRVERTFSFNSDVFTIHEERSDGSPRVGCEK